jgi:hypothetical protein
MRQVSMIHSKNIKIVSTSNKSIYYEYFGIQFIINEKILEILS